MAKARAVKLCTKRDYIKSCQSDDKSPLKGAWFCSRDLFLYAQLWSCIQKMAHVSKTTPLLGVICHPFGKA